VPLVEQPPRDQYTDHILAVARRAGLNHVGVASARPMLDVRTILEERKTRELHDTMEFTYRNPTRSTDPSRTVEGARSLVVAAMPYGFDTPDAPAGPHGRVARYARRDVYRSLADALTLVATELRRDGHRALVCVDDNALVDRAAAYRAGLGWFGKNANILVQGAGSFFVLGSVVTSAYLDVNGETVGDGCGNCRRCIDACPTGAIVEPGVVDARRCLSWLLQKPGIFPREYRVALGDRIYGCDDCQEVCPPSIRLREHVELDATDMAWVSVMTLLCGDDADVLAAIGRWYVPKRDLNVVRRNALVVLGNVGPADAETRAVIARYLDHEDENVRAHAVWAGARLGFVDLLPGNDDSELVCDELRHLPSPR
jgi:epoxyqueuosine reductase